MGKKEKENLGRALIKDRFSKNRHKKHVEGNSMLHTTEVNDGYDWGRLNLQSVTAESSLQEFLSTAELAEKEFTAEKLNIHYVKSAPSHVAPVTSQPDFSETLTLPRRPPWLPGVSAEEQASKEKDAFLEWRKHLNELQNKLGAALTPYERNLELWKQLWRTLERSDLVLLLLDARNPLLFRSADLESYAVDQKCKCILLLNKADLITEYERKCWAEHFDKEGTQVVFFSAAKTTIKEKELAEESDNSANTDSEDSDSDDEAEEIEERNDTEEDIEVFKKQVEELDRAVSTTADKLNRIQAALDKVLENIKLGLPAEPLQLSGKTNSQASSETIGKNEESNPAQNSSDILDREQLLHVLKNYKAQLKLKNPPHLTVGMIGYPNVGKSSTVNILMQTKKVSVSAMPGHTRHIQSLVLDEDVHIVDCPGLVLPAYAVAADLLLTAVLPIDQVMLKICTSWDCPRLVLLAYAVAGDVLLSTVLPIEQIILNTCTAWTIPVECVVAAILLLTAILPINQMKSFEAAVCRLCELVPRRTVEKQYGLLLPTHEHSHTLNYNEVLTAHAYNRGFMTAAGQADVSRSARLLLKDAASGRLRWAVLPAGCLSETTEEEQEVELKRKPTPMEARLVEGWSSRSQEIDKSFFGAGQGLAHTKGKPIPGLSGVPVAPTQDASGKPWKKEKKHANKNKREKLRRVYAHLDQH